jgi:hypothetical protein
MPKAFLISALGHKKKTGGDHPASLACPSRVACRLSILQPPQAFSQQGLIPGFNG